MHAEKSYLIIYLSEQKPKNLGDQSGRNHWSNKKKQKFIVKLTMKIDYYKKVLPKIFSILTFFNLSLSLSINLESIFVIQKDWFERFIYLYSQELYSKRKKNCLELTLIFLFFFTLNLILDKNLRMCVGG